jgi:glycosyltransferase involved in cell wall biosynthesis
MADEMTDFLHMPGRPTRNRVRRSPSRERPTRNPLVSVLLPTHNRPRYLVEALASVVQQTYRNLEIFVIRDGGQDVADVIRSFDDPRIIFIDRKENRGKPFSLNEALSRARGEYVAYLDDDDVYYPRHVEVLVKALESGTDCGAAYSDLYKVYCEVLGGGGRVVLSKHVEIGRDFDRFLMLYFNHVLHVSLMHRRDLLERTGLYNETLNVLIDWDMTRRLAFFTDFLHVPVITGEFYSPVDECDRISVQQRKDPEAYLRNLLAIRTTRPAGPWPKLQDLSIILLVDRVDEGTAETLLRIWRHTFYPYKLYLPLPPGDISRLNVQMPNVEFVPVDPAGSATARVDAALSKSGGDLVAVAPARLPIEEMWIEHPVYALLHTAAREGFFLAGATPQSWAAVLRRTDLESSRRAYPRLSVEASLQAAGVLVRWPTEDELPFQFDELLRQAKAAEAEGNWRAAARLFEQLGDRFQNRLWMKAMAARAYFEAGDHAKAGRLSHEANRERATVDTLLLEAKVHRHNGDFDTAVGLLGRARQLLDGYGEGPARTEASLCSTSSKYGWRLEDHNEHGCRANQQDR